MATIEERIQVYRMGVDQALSRFGFSVVSMHLGRSGGGQAFWRLSVQDEERMIWALSVEVPSHFELDFEEVAELVATKIQLRIAAILRKAETDARRRETFH